LTVAHETRRPVKHPSIGEVRSWASHLACESRDISWLAREYVIPDAVKRIVRLLTVTEGGIIGLVGYQGVGKSSALLWLQFAKIASETVELKRKHKTVPDDYQYGVVRFKWRREPELFKSLLDGTHEMSSAFGRAYGLRLLEPMKRRFPLADFREAERRPETLNFNWAEKTFGSHRAVNELRKVIWLEVLRSKKTILIDMPDYSKTDKRAMAKDFEEVYWLWNFLSDPTLRAPKPNLVIAIQKELFQGHFFFDKMQRVDLQPMQPDMMVEAYKGHFKATEPFSEEALLTLARMSRGIFRRFLRYITLTLDHWEMEHRRPDSRIGVAVVKEAVTVERLADDMELELVDLFPKHSELRILAVRLLMLLEEQGPQKQSQLTTLLDLEPYAVSRLLTRLETARYVTRTRDGTDKVVALKPTS
jgi:hypothetical protein